VPESDAPVASVVPQPRPQSDVDVAAEVARAAGAVLLQLRESAPDDPDLRDRGDREAQAAIAELLGALRPDDAVLSEEAADDPVRLSSDRVWIVDPLDGTREYGEAGREDWAVHVALWERTSAEGGELTSCAVALPARDLVLTTDTPRGGAAAPAASSGRVRLAVSRSRATDTVKELAAELDAELVPMGSAGFKVSAVVLGTVDAYVHTGGQYEWDSAAPVAVARAAGLHTSRVDGSPLVYNRADPLLPDLVVCRPELAADVLAVLRRLLHLEGTP